MDTPHFAVPFRLDKTGRFATVEQDGTDEIAQCVHTLIATPIGSRVELPEYGCPRSEFVGPNPEDISDAVSEWEERAELSVEVIRGLGLTQTGVDVTARIRPHL